MYRIKEVVSTWYTESPFSCVPIVLVRFYGCNIDPRCYFCDDCEDEFKVLSADAIYGLIVEYASRDGISTVLLTGGEPMLQIDDGMSGVIGSLRRMGLDVIIETNGTIPLVEYSAFRSEYYGSLKSGCPGKLSFVCSPKPGSDVLLKEFMCLKYVIPGGWESYVSVVESIRELCRVVSGVVSDVGHGGYCRLEGVDSRRWVEVYLQPEYSVTSSADMFLIGTALSWASDMSTMLGVMPGLSVNVGKMLGVP